MKKFLILVVILAIVGGYFYYKNLKPGEIAPDTVSDNNFKPDPSSATFTFDDGKITLSNGRNTLEEGGEVVLETFLLQQRATGDINADKKDDTVILLAQSGGASGVFIYVAAYISGPVSYKGTNAVFVGDRISPESLSIKNGVITLKYLDRRPDEPFSAEPTVETSKQFVFKNGSIEEK